MADLAAGMDREQLRTLAAVIDAGTFDAAARRLSITPSAVSQRIKALESQSGQVLVHRTKPCQATQAGAVLLRAARQLDEIEADIALSLGQLSTAPLAMVVNADSLATWFVDVVDAASTWSDTDLRIHVEDEKLSHQLLRTGQVLGAVTTSDEAVAGCRVVHLGAMRYVPVGSPWLVQGTSAEQRKLSNLPTLCFNDVDQLSERFAEQVDGRKPSRLHYVPSSQGYLYAIQAGLGWGMVPEVQAKDPLERGDLVRLDAGWRDVDLYWQCWSLHTERLDRLSEAVTKAAAAGLRSG